MHQKKLQIAETEIASTLNKVYNGNKKKKRLKKLRKMGMTKKVGMKKKR